MAVSLYVVKWLVGVLPPEGSGGQPFQAAAVAVAAVGKCIMGGCACNRCPRFPLGHRSRVVGYSPRRIRKATTRTIARVAAITVTNTD